MSGQEKRARGERRILGIDPGSRICGYALLDGCQYLECGVLGGDPRAPLEQRLGELARDLRAIIEEFAPDVVAVEDVFCGRNPRSAFALAHARGVVFAVAGMAGLEVCSYPPAMVKKAVTGRGRASKEQVGAMVRSLVGLQGALKTDAADALAVALTHAHRQPRLA